MVDNEIRLRTELEGCDRMIVERRSGIKLRQFLLGISRKIYVLVEREVRGGSGFSLPLALASTRRDSPRVFRNNVGRRGGEIESVLRARVTARAE